MLRQTLAALQRIPRDAVVIRYIDNASTDDSVALVRRMLPYADVIELTENKGFAGAHNVGFARCTTPLVLTLDPDVELNWQGIMRVLAAFDDPRVGAAQGKLYRSNPGTARKRVIDSAGIVHTLALNGKERGANEEDGGQYDVPARLLAVTGACGVYRMEALREVAYGAHSPWLAGVKEIFDNDFFSYKEDVDLGWRLNNAGWKVLYVPIAVGVHRRTLGKRGVLGWGLHLTAIYMRLKSSRTRYSLRNYVWMLVKNITLTDDLKHEFFIDARLFAFFALSLLYPPLLSVWWETVRGLPRMLEKRTMYPTALKLPSFAKGYGRAQRGTESKKRTIL